MGKIYIMEGEAGDYYTPTCTLWHPQGGQVAVFTAADRDALIEQGMELVSEEDPVSAAPRKPARRTPNTSASQTAVTA